MPRKPHVPKYGLHKPTGQARVVIDGRHHYLGPHGSAESRQAYARLVAEHAAVGLATPLPAGPDRCPDLTINELLVRAVEHADAYYQRNGKPTGEATNIREAVAVVRALYGRTPAQEFGPRALAACQQRMVDQGLARTTINGRVRKIRLVFQWAVAWELVPPGVLTALRALPGLRAGRTVAREPQPVLPVTDAAVEATLPFAAPVVRDMIRLQRLTGMRPQDVCNLKLGDVVDRDQDVWVFRPAEHKTAYHGRARIVHLGPKAQALLRPYLLRPGNAPIFSPAEAERWRREQREPSRERKTKLYPCEVRRVAAAKEAAKRRKRKRPPGTRYTPESYYRAVQYAIAKARKAGVDLSPWSPNQLRHTKGTEVRRDYGLEAAQVTLGHAHAKITEVYAERDLSLAKRVALATG